MLRAPLKVYVTCVVALYVKFLVTTMIQATKTFAAGRRSPEDSNHVLARGVKQNYGLRATPDDDKDSEAAMLEVRWKRIVMNDVESLPMALFVFGAGVLVDAHEGVHIGAMVAYTVARVGHTIAYGMALQPYRAYCWRVGVLAILTGGVAALVAAYN